MGSAPVSRETLPKILNTALDIRFQQEEKKRKKAMESGIADIIERVSAMSGNVEGNINKFSRQLKEIVNKVKRHEVQLGGRGDPPNSSDNEDEETMSANHSSYHPEGSIEESATVSSHGKTTSLDVDMFVAETQKNNEGSSVRTEPRRPL